MNELEFIGLLGLAAFVIPIGYSSGCAVVKICSGIAHAVLEKIRDLTSVSKAPHWLFYKLVELVFPIASRRFYEALVHCNCGWLVSLGNMFGLCHTTRVSSEYDCKGVYATKTFFGRLDPNTKRGAAKLRAECKTLQTRLVENAKRLMGEEWEHYTGIEEVFVCGYNVCCSLYAPSTWNVFQEEPNNE